MSYEYTVNIPASKRAKFRALVKELGGAVSRGRKRCGLDEALEDIEMGRLAGPFESADAMFKELLGHGL